MRLNWSCRTWCLLSLSLLATTGTVAPSVSAADEEAAEEPSWSQEEDLEALDDQGTWEDATPEPPVPINSSDEKTPDEGAERPMPPPPQNPTRKIGFSGTVELDYFFYHNRETLRVIYTFTMDEEYTRPHTLEKRLQQVLSGETPVTVQVEGYLAKKAGIECQLEVTVPKLAYTLEVFEEVNGSATFTLQHAAAGESIWKSLCSFAGYPKAAFNTTGPPEVWFDLALEKIRDAFKAVPLRLSDGLETSFPYEVTLDSVDDDTVGRVDMVALGTLTLSGLQLQ